MTGKEGKSAFFKAIIVAGFILLANIGFFAYIYKNNFTGFSISSILDGFVKTSSGISQVSKIFFISQWVLILVILISVFVYDHIGKTKEIVEIKSKRVSGKFSTDLDTLYSILQDKKKLKISTISKAFNVSEEVAMDWCKILESGNLAVIDYPGVGQPVIKLP